MELKGSKTEKNLMEAFAGESMARSKYTFFASVAKKAGSSSISAATTPSTSAKGSTPTEKRFIWSWLREMTWLNTSTTANLAISLGCSVPSPGSTSQRLQPLYSGIKSTATSKTRERASSGQASLWKI